MAYIAYALISAAATTVYAFTKPDRVSYQYKRAGKSLFLYVQL
jgi:hypothetical protein